MHWRLDVVGVTSETLRSSLEKEMPFLRPANLPPGMPWLNSVTPEQKAQVSAAIDAVVAAVAAEQRSQVAKGIDTATAAAESVVKPGATYNVSVSGHDAGHVEGLVSRISIAIDEIIPQPKPESKPERLVLGGQTPSASP